MKSAFIRNERQVRIKLEERINNIFKEIYDGGLKISVDESYNIKVTVQEENIEDNELEKNTAQSYSIIFAFIAGIIDMAKEKANTDSASEENIFSEAAVYPLVMDAPLSAFDKTRIRKIFESIPRIAQQVILFI